MRQLIEYLQILLSQENQRSTRKTLTPEALYEQLSDDDFHGTSVLLNIRSLPGTKAFLIISRGEFGSRFSGDANPGLSLSDITQLLIYPLNMATQGVNGNVTIGSQFGRDLPIEMPSRSSATTPDIIDLITVPQRQFLFSLLIKKNGLSEAEATEYLKKTFKVESLELIPKFAASQLIDHLRSEEGGS